MQYTEAILLAVLQGVTEFLPVSSSGHLVLAQQLLGGTQHVDLRYDVFLHVATAAALVAYLRRDVSALFRAFLASAPVGAGLTNHTPRMLAYIALATIPTGLLGLGIEHFLLVYVMQPGAVGLMFVVTGCILWWGRGRHPRRSAQEMTAADALALGALQGTSVLPGLSRSGTTITGGIALGLDRDWSARFSLLIAIPAILGAAAVQVHHALVGPPAPWGPYCAGMLVAALVGYVSIGLLLRLVRRDSFHWFALYLWPLGGMSLALDGWF